MSPDTKEFFGKDVASAIKEACSALGVAQENMSIEVIETGSTGIFGLIRKKAHIRVTAQADEAIGGSESVKLQKKRTDKPKAQKRPPAPIKEDVEDVPVSPDPPPSISETAVATDDSNDGPENNDFVLVEVSAESLVLVKEELEKILELMTCPSEVTVEDVRGTVQCRVSADYEDDLTGQDGRTLDSLQYLLRKIVSRKISERIRLTIDIGNYRERRHQELHDKAIDYAALVKQNGKTQVIPSLNPSERRVVHVALQEDSEIRSRSVGDGLFKKVLIYKPGNKGRKNNVRKKPRGKYKKKSESGQKKEPQS